MSQENVEYARSAVDAFNARDRERFMQHLDPEVVWHPVSAPLLEQTTYHGPEEVCRLAFDEIPLVIEGFASEIREVIDVDEDRVLVILKFAGHLASADMNIDQVFGFLFRLKEGRAVELRSYSSKQEALEAAGLWE